jgi:hypothetical protein
MHVSAINGPSNSVDREASARRVTLDRARVMVKVMVKVKAPRVQRRLERVTAQALRPASVARRSFDRNVAVTAAAES